MPDDGTPFYHAGAKKKKRVKEWEKVHLEYHMMRGLRCRWTDGIKRRIFPSSHMTEKWLFPDLMPSSTLNQ
jgi:hypothetical protein